MNKFNTFFKANEIYKKGLRTRLNLAIYWDKNEPKFCMFNEDKKRIFNIDFSFVCDEIQSFLPHILNTLEDRQKLFEVRIFSTSNSLCLILLYHKSLSNFDIQKEWQKLKKFTKQDFKLIALAKKEKLAYPNDLLIHKSNDIVYNFNHECFIQPSLKMNEKMINFALSCVDDKANDLLELYCGYGNFTLALAKKFNKVFATELSKNNIKFLEQNIKNNNIFNIFYARLSDNEVVNAINKERKFNRLNHINLDEFNFNYVLVDPPRSGLASCVKLIKNYENIIYISCSLKSAKEDLKELEKTHYLKKTALFDQFVNSNEHIEAGFYLVKKN